MGGPEYDGIRLPRSIREELGIPKDDTKSGRRRGYVASNRKAQRKDERATRKDSRRPVQKGNLNPTPRQEPGASSRTIPSREEVSQRPSKSQTQAQPGGNVKAESSTPTKKVSRSVKSEATTIAPPIRRDKALVRDDAEIEALEKALGLQDKKSYPKVFEEEGLESLLDGIEDFGKDESLVLGKRKRGRDLAIHNSPKHVREVSLPLSSDPNSDDSDFGGFDHGDGESLAEESETGFSGGTDLSDIEESIPDPPKVRENPYRAPATGTGESTVNKYVPPSMRNLGTEDTPDVVRLRRQLQGQLNRLSESNMIFIAAEVEKMSKEVPRQAFFTSLSDLIIERLLDRSALNETFIILLAGFTAALCKVMGPEFAVLIITQADAKFQSAFVSQQEDGQGSKVSVNVLAFLTHLYLFQIVTARLVFDFIRLCINDISESNTELLLRVFRISGHQIRQDDPSALREIVESLQKKIDLNDAKTLSVRTKFMLETIQDLKNNKSKHGMTAASIASEHTIGMKKTLGTLGQRTLKMTEPLGIGLEDIRNSKKQGRWWLVGASYQEPHHQSESVRGRESRTGIRDASEDADGFNDLNDLALLARENKMNTDVRRGIFIAIMSSSDCDDAYMRLKKLGLRRSQDIEIPKVIVRCAASEKAFNPFYAALLTRVCTDRKLKMAIQFSIWDLFKQMGETNDNDDSDDQSEEATSKLSLREVVNLACTFGTVIANGTQTLGFLKVLNLTYLQQHTRIFLEVLLTTMIIQTQRDQAKGRNEGKLLRPFLESKDLADMASSVHFFMRENLSKSDIAGSSAERRTVKWGCRVAGDALSVLAQRQN